MDVTSLSTDLAYKCCGNFSIRAICDAVLGQGAGIVLVEQRGDTVNSCSSERKPTMEFEGSLLWKTKSAGQSPS